MFLAMSNKAKGLLLLSYIDQVDVPELPAGFKILVDLERLESMDIACIEELGKMMELFDQHGLEQVVRVIPDPMKDIGFNILARFHYHHNPRITNCKTMVEAAKLLEL